jgi:cell division protein FtsQ
VTAWAAAGAAGAGVAYGCVHFLLTSPEMALIQSEQLEISGNHNVSHASVLDIFQYDHGRSIVRIPLEERRREIESIPWVEQATVRRALPRTIQIDIAERTPIAFLREGSDMALMDAHGAIFERPLQGRFHFPVVTGIGTDMTAEEREKRMQLFTGFLQGLASARAGAVEQVSEVDLSDAHDLRASLTGLQAGSVAGTGSPPANSPEASSDSDAPILVHFGDGDFESKYETLMDKMGQWRATAGRVESVDLRFNGEAVVNSDTPAVARVQQPVPPPKRGTKHAR